MKDKITASILAMSLSMPAYSSMFGEETAVTKLFTDNGEDLSF